MRELREAAGLTQKQLAENAGMALSGVTHLEQGLRIPSWPSVLALAGALGVDCTAFTQEPGDVEPRGKGRPAKAEAPAPPAKRSGRSRKA
jgi:transcriptional regulator with XRE-family HTH domain